MHSDVEHVSAIPNWSLFHCLTGSYLIYQSASQFHISADEAAAGSVEPAER